MRRIPKGRRDAESSLYGASNGEESRIRTAQRATKPRAPGRIATMGTCLLNICSFGPNPSTQCTNPYSISPFGVLSVCEPPFHQYIDRRADPATGAPHLHRHDKSFCIWGGISCVDDHPSVTSTVRRRETAILMSLRLIQD
jgi:hypothetical protein